MVQLCAKCSKLLREGDEVTVRVTSTYHVLKSTIAYALSRENMIADPDTLEHVDCDEAQGGD
jgi:hypothetical protein